MAKRTLEQQLVAGLLALGFVEGPRLTHYRTFTPTEASREKLPIQATKLFVGKAGAFRGSRSGTVGATFKYNSRIRDQVIAAGAEKNDAKN